MAKRTPKPNIGGLVFFLGVVALVLDLAQAREHQKTCPKCLGRDYVEIALDLAHLWGMP